MKCAEPNEPARRGGGIGNTLCNRVLTKELAVPRPILACPPILYYPGNNAPNFTVAREPHMDQPDNGIWAADASGAWQVEVRNWGYTDGHVETFNHR